MSLPGWFTSPGCLGTRSWGFGVGGGHARPGDAHVHLELPVQLNTELMNLYITKHK